MLSIRLHSFNLSTSVDILAFLFGVVSLSARNRLYMFVVGRIASSQCQIVVVIAINLFVQFMFTVLRRFSLTVLLSMVCELSLIVLIAQWLFRFRRYSKEGEQRVRLGCRASFLPSNDVFHPAISQRYRFSCSASLESVWLFVVWPSLVMWMSSSLGSRFLYEVAL